MGLKIFDLPPDGMQDGAQATLDKEQSTSTEVKPQIVTEQVSPDDPIKKKVKSANTGVPYESLVGYKKFMLINGKWDEDYREEKAVYCEFDTNHVLKGVLLVEGEFEKYFE